MSDTLCKKSITCPTQDGTLLGESVPLWMGHSELWHGRTPADILLNPDIGDFEKVVYGILSLKTYQGNIATVGVRRLAVLTKRSKSKVHRAVKELIALGHVRQAPKIRGQRTRYMLTSPVFGQKQRTGMEETAPAPSGGRRLVSSPKHIR